MFKLQQQKVKDKYLGQNSSQRRSRLGRERTKNILIFAVL